jgi:hypothetical protein
VSSTIAEVDAAYLMTKLVKWMRLFMEDLGVPFEGPAPLAEDNADTRLIAHAGKVTRNMRHIAAKTCNIQDAVRYRLAHFRAVGTNNNRAYHFTKALLQPSHKRHWV